VEPRGAWQRASSSGTRPLALDRDRFMALHDRRRPLYEEAADGYLPAGDRGLVHRALPAVTTLLRAPAQTKLVWATSRSGEYPVFVGPGVLDAAVWPTEPAGRRICVTDANVGPLHGDRVPAVDATVTLPAGEQHKTLATAEHVWRELARAGMGREDELVALGGGVVGDLAGFCAATYQRGVPVVQVPTTLVAQVDSAYGGKTGVDLPEAKNYVGAYHQPAGVLADTSLLASLPPAELAAGHAEVLKTALIAGGELWERVAGGEEVDATVILACIRTKLEVVALDERDEGARQVLNLGHTVGHAIETATAYARYRHGEAVGLGLLAALRLSGQDELRQQVASLLERAGLPTRLEDADPAAVTDAVQRDKKRRRGEVRFVLVRAPGQIVTGQAVDPDEVASAVQELAA
jgi:shikimate kinase / 3-dehydroquinate synthase